MKPSIIFVVVLRLFTWMVINSGLWLMWSSSDRIECLQCLVWTDTSFLLVSENVLYSTYLDCVCKRLEMESNWIEQISNWFLSNFSNYFSPLNQSNHKFWNRTNFERIPIWLHPYKRLEILHEWFYICSSESVNLPLKFVSFSILV